MGQRLAYLTLLPAVAVAVVIGGLFGGVLAIILSVLAAHIILALIHGEADLLGLAAFLVSSATFVFIAQLLRLAQREALASKSMMEVALSSMTDAVFIADAEGRLIHFNEAFATFHKFGGKEQCARTLAEYHTLFELFTPDGAPAPLEQWAVQRALRGETAVGQEYALRRKDTGEQWLGSYSFAPIRNANGVIVGSVVTARDVTVQRQAEVDLRDHRRRLKATFDASMEGIIAIDSDGDIKAANPAALEMFGYRMDEIVGRSFSMLMPQNDGVERVFDKTMIGGRRKLSGLRKNGETFPQELTVAEATVHRERLCIAFIRDLGPIEAERRRVHDLRDQLVHVSRMNDMGEVVAALAHELGQPLTAIRSYGAAGRRLLLAGETALIGDIVGKIETQARCGSEILVRLRGFIQKRHPERTQESLRHLIADAMSLAALLHSAARPPSVALDLLETDIAVDVDRIQIQQVLFNFLRNAAEAAACETKPEIVVSLAPGKPGFVHVSVSDNGPGVAEAIEDQLFNPFVTTKKYGMGVGLSLCKSIIDSHQGEIGFRANTPRGAVFFFTLPLSEGPAADDRGPELSYASPRPNEGSITVFPQ